MPVLDLRNFSGGLNLRDSLEQLGLNETPDALNKTLTTRGAAVVRNGCTQVATLPGAPRFLFYSKTLDKWFVHIQEGATQHLFVRPGDLSGSWVSHLNVGSNALVAMVDFGTLAVISVTDNQLSRSVWTTDGTTATNRTVNAGGATVAVFKNRVWVSASAVAETPYRVWFSNLGDVTAWTPATDYVDVREKDNDGIVALAGTGPGLLVFKNRSAYRVTDASSGGYQTIDWNSGCVAKQGAVTLEGIAYTWGADGIYAWDGTGRGIQISDKIRPRFFSNSSIPVSEFGVCSGRIEDRIVFGYPLDGFNVRILELHPRHGVKTDELPAAGWIMDHLLAQAGEQHVASFANKGGELYAVLADGDVMYRMFAAAPGADDGVPFTSYYKTPPLTLGKLSRPERIRIYAKAAAAGTNTKEFRTYRDWQATVDETFDLTTNFETADGEEVADLFSLDHAEAHQFEFRTYGGTGAAEFARLLVDLTELER